MLVASHLVALVLVGYIVVDVVRFQGGFARLKRELAAGSTTARSRVYREALVFECVTAALALLSLWLAGRAMDPRVLGLEGAPLLRQLTGTNGVHGGFIGGMAGGVIIGALVIALAGRRKRTSSDAPAAPNVFQRLMPDFSALIPTTAKERWLWVAVSISAGVCEEIVFRGWLLATLHGVAGLGATPLLVVAAVGFGLAHAYQGPAGVLLTGFAGAVFCAIYVLTGSLLLPILLHIAMDARFALVPAPVEYSVPAAG